MCYPNSPLSPRTNLSENVASLCLLYRYQACIYVVIHTQLQADSAVINYREKITLEYENVFMALSFLISLGTPD